MKVGNGSKSDGTGQHNLAFCCVGGTEVQELQCRHYAVTVSALYSGGVGTIQSRPMQYNLAFC